MPTFTTDQPVNAAQLAEEIGNAAVSVTEVDGQNLVRVTKPGYTNAALAAAVAEHEATEPTPGSEVLSECEVCYAMVPARNVEQHQAWHAGQG